MRRSLDDYNADERGRYDGDTVWQGPDESWYAMVRAEADDSQAAWDAYCAQFKPLRQPCETERICGTCHGQGHVRAHPDGDATCLCYACDGEGVLA